MFDLKVRSSGARTCPLCMDELDGPERFTCNSCSVGYHSECARELGGCGTLGCAQAGIGPDGPASLASLRRHISRVGGGPVSAMDPTAVNQRAEVIREALLEQRAKLIRERQRKERYETSQRRRRQFELALTLVLLGVALYWLVAMIRS